VVDSQACVGILKLEREDAIRVQPTGDAGARTFNIAHLTGCRKMAGTFWARAAARAGP
jgi:hypothetical protein